MYNYHLSSQAMNEDTMQSQHITQLLDAATMKADIENLKRTQGEQNTRLLHVLSEMAADVKLLGNALTAVPRQIAECRNDMRDEIDRDFPNKPEAMLMEQRIEKQIADVDKTLGKQIADVDKRMTVGMTDVAAQITKVDNKVEKIWIKITVVVTTVMAVGGLLQWLLLMKVIG